MHSNTENIDNPFSDREYKEKFEKLAAFIRSFDKTVIKNISGKFNKHIKKIENPQSLLITLTAIYLETDFIKWESARRRTQDFQSLFKAPKKGFLNKIFKSKKNENKDNDDDKDFTDMYINIGKDKKIFPGHLIQFICMNLSIKQSNIRNIRIFESYSFFKIPKDLTDKAVILLSVKKFRGKNIIVNFSKNQD